MANTLTWFSHKPSCGLFPCILGLGDKGDWPLSWNQIWPVTNSIHHPYPETGNSRVPYFQCGFSHMPLLLAHKLGSLCNPYYTRDHSLIQEIIRDHSILYYIIDYETSIPVRCFPPFDMEIKTLLDNLHEEVPCSVCQCKFANPKQLPCLRSWSVQRSRSFWDSRYHDHKQNSQKSRYFCSHSK